MKIRTDIHRPSAINPTEYEYVGIEYLKIQGLEDCAALIAARERIKAHMTRTGGTYSRHEHGGNCHVCGASCIYTVLFYHATSNTYIRTGNDCADKMDMGDKAAFKKFHDAIVAARKAKTGKLKAQGILAQAELSQAWAIYTAKQVPVDAQGRSYYEEMTIIDIVGKLVKYGSVTDKAMNFLRSLVTRIGQRAEIEAKRAEEAALAADCPKGRVQISGEVVTTRMQDGYYGSTLKMLVKDNSGFKVWGTVPSNVAVEKGDQITFMAAVEPSKDDCKFGFFKRPTQTVVAVKA